MFKERIKYVDNFLTVRAPCASEFRITEMQSDQMPKPFLSKLVHGFCQKVGNFWASMIKVTRLGEA
jgi:hypothetical protein